MVSLVDQNLASVCGQVWAEYLGGFRSWAERERARRLFKALRPLETTWDDYDGAAELKVRHGGLGYGDLLIAAVALRHECVLLTLDKDFAPLAKEGLKVLYHGV